MFIGFLEVAANEVSYSLSVTDVFFPICFCQEKQIFLWG